LPELAILLKADVEGSVDAIMQVIETYSSDDQCHLHVVDFGVGSPTIGDLQLAIDAKGLSCSFAII
jgi:translation initiation factor IF-2